MNTIISHSPKDVEYQAHYDNISHRIRNEYPPEDQARLFDLLNMADESYLGRFLIVNRGLNGLMTQYVVLYPKYKDLHPNTYPNGETLSDFDRAFLEGYPTVRATQERFDIFQEQLLKHLKPNSHVATLPCGLMDDLLTLPLPENFSGTFTGIDADPLSIQQAHFNTEATNREELCEFYIQDAWNLDLPRKYDVILSNGLNIYVDSEDKVIELYKSFYNALADNGILITSFLTPSPASDPDSEWNIQDINMALAQRQKEMFVDILGVNWTHFYSSSQVTEQLKTAGFKTIEFHWDRQKMFPTVVAYK